MGSTEHQRQIIDTFVNSVYVFDDRVVLNFNFTDDAKMVTREEVLGSSAVENAPPLAQIRVTNTVDFKSKSTVFLRLSASKFIAILQILCKIKVEVHMDLVSAINFYLRISWLTIIFFASKLALSYRSA